MRPFVTRTLTLLTLCAYSATAARAEINAEQVRRSIDDAIVYLQKQQQADGSFPELLPIPGGVTALVTLSLLTAGVPADDPSMQQALKYLRSIDPKMTYVVALQTMVFCLAEPEKDLLLIRRNVQYLESIQKRDAGANGTWGYSANQGKGDNSNAQFALLALHEAERVGVSSSEQTWRLAREHWLNSQNPDGSWGYTPKQSGTGSMTCAGIAALIMASEKLDPGDAAVDGDTVRCCGEQLPNDAIERGRQWLAQHFSVQSNPGDPFHILYYLYGMERVGRLTNQRLINGHDWYREAADFLIRNQAQLRGFWKGVGSGESDPTVGTCFALLFLSKGRRPVLAAKLAFGPDDSWNLHRQDLANLTHYCERKWERELTWQTIEARRATADDLIQAPVLYISGSKSPEISDAEVKVLRQYLDLGGFIFAEGGECHGTAFDVGFRELMERIFPERDETGRPLYGLRLLPPDHSVWAAEEPIDPKLIEMAPLYGVDVGCRTSVIYCPKELGCYWELDRVGRKRTFSPRVEDEIRAMRSVGINVMAYATNREVKYKLEIPQIVRADGPADKLERAKLYVAEVKHGGGSGVAPAALVNLMKQLSVDTGLRVSAEKRELALTQESLFDYHLVFMHGRQSFTFSDAERKQLRAFVERGGMLFADAVCSSEEFASSFRREMAEIFPETPLRPIPAKHAMFGELYGGFDLGTVTLRDPRRGDAAGPLRTDVVKVPPELEGIQFGTRYGVIFSKYDLSCALERQNSLECTGYSRDDAAKIGINVVLFSLRGNL
jgi:hypothetical protein